MKESQFYIYLLTNKFNNVLYIGVTRNLKQRIMIYQRHINLSSFVKRYKLTKLVYFEIYSQLTDAINREKQLKNWHRQWKINLVNSINPDWVDLKGPILMEE